jgi:hypothetical protein
VGFISGAGINKKNTVLSGKIFVGDFFLSILTFVAKGLTTDPLTGARVSNPGSSRTWRDIIQPGMEQMPLLPGDGMDLWPYLSGANETSARTEILHEVGAFRCVPAAQPTAGHGPCTRPLTAEWFACRHTSWGTGMETATPCAWGTTRSFCARAACGQGVPRLDRTMDGSGDRARLTPTPP